MRTVQPVSPGEMLEEEFLKPLGLTKYRLAKDIGVPAQRIGEIVAGRRSVTADTDYKGARCWSRRNQKTQSMPPTSEILLSCSCGTVEVQVSGNPAACAFWSVGFAKARPNPPLSSTLG